MKVFLNGIWSLKSQFLSNTLKVNVPGSIYNDLITNGLLDDPYYRDNEKRTNKCLNYDYFYSRNFSFKEEEIKNKIYLCFEGIDTVARIFINDCEVLQTFNMHRRYRVLVNNFLKVGLNTITIQIMPVFIYMNDEAKKSKYEFMQMNYAIKNYNFIRKSHCMFGWDWGPQLPDSGIFRDVYFEIIESSVIKDVEVHQQTEKSFSKLTITVENEIIHSTTTKIELFEDNKLIYETFQISKNKNIFRFAIDNPHLWNPSGYGEQFLYNLKVSNIYYDKEIDSRVVKIGLRKMEVQRIKDKYGVSFTICVNNQPIFVKGSNYIIEDNILPRTSYERTRKLLTNCINCNHNGIRVWGGGIYPSNYFYDLCDELGLIVWQDLMFACTYYDIDNQNFMEEIKYEIIDNLKRIRNHPCLALICGNNENELALEWNPPNPIKTKENYLYQYEEFIPKILNKVAPYIFYWPSSPSSGGNFDNPNDDKRGDMHYWGVWHSNEPIEYYRNYYPRFMSECGLQSFPSFKTIKSFTTKEDLNIYSYVMECHQKNGTANSKIMNYVSKMFKFPKNFESLIYLSQLTQAEGIRYCVEHLRRNYGRCMGILYWQLNDCWPVASWSSIDYYGRYKALQYESKRFYNPILLSIEENRDNCNYKFYVTNETKERISGVVKIQLFDLNGILLWEKEIEVEVNNYASKMVFEEKLNLSFSKKQMIILVGKLFIGKKLISDSSVNFVPDKYLKLMNPQINYQLTRKDNNYQIELKCSRVAKYVQIDVKNNDLILDDNYFNLYPNEVKIVKFKSNKQILNKDIIVKSLFDSFQ